MSHEESNFFGRLLKSKIFFILIIILFLFSSLELLNEIGRRNKISNEIKKQKQQIEKLEQENTDLSSLIQYYNTNSYVESEARKKLNLSKSGESLVVIENTTKATTSDQQIVSNPQRWWNYFLK
jgi:cell division protein FtsB